MLLKIMKVFKDFFALENWANNNCVKNQQKNGLNFEKDKSQGYKDNYC